VTGTNDAPVAVADVAGGGENQSVLVDVLANDTDVDNGAIRTLLSVGAPAGKGSVSISGGQLLFNPGTDFDHLAAGATELVTLSYTMQDEFGAQSSATVAYTVTGANDAPVAVADTAAGGENQILSVNVLANDTDVDDNASFTLVSGAAPAGKGSVSVSGNQLVFNPGTAFDHLAAGQTETVILDYNMRDQNGGSSSSTLTATITGTNDAPTALALSNASILETAAAGTVVGTLVGTDPDDAATLGYSLVGGRTDLFEIVGSQLRLRSGAEIDYEAVPSHAVTIRVTDEYGAVLDRAFTIAVTNANEAPVWNLAVNGDFERGPFVNNGSGWMSLTQASTTIPGWTVTGAGGVDWHMADDTQGRLFVDLAGSSAGGVQQSIATLVGAVYRLDFDLAANPAFQSIETIQVNAGATSQSFSFDATGRSLQNMGWQSKSVSFTATSASTLVSLASASPNDSVGPALDNVRVTLVGFGATEDAVLSSSVRAVDPDGNALTYSLVGANGGAAHGAIALNANGSFTYAPDANYFGTDSFTVRASDGSLAANQTFTISVAGVNDAPTLSGLNSPITYVENAAAQVIDASMVLGDAEGNFAGGRLLVSGLLAEDRVSILNQGNGAGQIGLAAGNVSYGGIVIGTVAGGSGSTLTVTLNASASVAAVDALVQALTYANASDTPTASRTLLVNLVDGAGAELPTMSGFAELTGAANPFAALGSPTRSVIATGDIDGDGDADLVVGASDGSFTTYRNDGGGSFARLSGAANPFNGLDTGILSAPALVDINGDGRVDLVAAGDQSGLRLFVNAGNGSFVERVGAQNPFNGLGFAYDPAPAFADIDNDGDVDMVLGEYGGTFHTYRNSNGVFAEVTGAANPFNGLNVGGSHAKPAFVDFDGDGDLDMVAGSYSGNYSAFRNNGDGSFTQVTGGANPFNGINGGLMDSLGFVDLNGDGRLDLVTGADAQGLRAFRSSGGVPVVVNVTAVNDAPVLASPIADQSALGSSWNFTLPAGLFTDADGNALAYSATLGSGGALPAWLHFDAATASFSGTVNAGDIGSLIDIKVSATDGTASASDTFTLSVGYNLIVGTEAQYSYVGSYKPANGAAYGTNPPVLTGQEAAALVFGGTASSYAVSTSATVITHTANLNGWGEHGSQYVFAEDYKLDIGGDGYATPAGGGTARSAWIQDGDNGTNYVWRITAGSDHITGTALNDHIVGTAGGEIIRGGGGADLLEGGGGADIFVFDTYGESSVSSFDIIRDFTPGTDKIALNAIDGNPSTLVQNDLLWVGNNADPGAGRVGWFYDGARNVTVIATGDPDGAGSMQALHIELQGHLTLSQSDFLFM
jgi:choice-of-anchor C domain-containing protein